MPAREPVPQGLGQFICHLHLHASIKRNLQARPCLRLSPFAGDHALLLQISTVLPESCPIGEVTHIVIDDLITRMPDLLNKLFSHCLHLRNMVGCFGIDVVRKNVQFSLVCEILLCIIGRYFMAERPVVRASCSSRSSPLSSASFCRCPTSVMLRTRRHHSHCIRAYDATNLSS